MRLDADQLEWIVREVVRRLQDFAPSGPLPLAGMGATSTGDPKSPERSRFRSRSDGEGGRHNPAASKRHADLTIADRLITISQLDGKLDGVARLTVVRRAVVTPAARDLLKQHNVELVRSDAT